MVALWALAQNYAEQWLLWLVVDLVCTILYIYKQIPFTAALYGFYTIMAVLGYRQWLKKIPSTADLRQQLSIKKTRNTTNTIYCQSIICAFCASCFLFMRSRKPISIIRVICILLICVVAGLLDVIK